MPVIDMPSLSPSSPSPPQQEVYLKQWHDVWTGFQRALRSPNDDFQAFQWTVRLMQAAMGYLYGKTGLYRLELHVYWRSSVPAIGMALIGLVVLSYYMSLRSVVQDRWCTDNIINTNDNNKILERCCRWIYLHDGCVAYLGCMMLFHMILACFRSPGVVLPNGIQGEEVQGGIVTWKAEHSSSTSQSPIYRWKAVNSQGGCCCIDPILSHARERLLAKMYDNICKKSKIEENQSKKKYFPFPEPTFCNNCRIQRPPRCHHCSICHRCILQFDHHCVWLNNCVGLGNYRHFFLTVLFLTLGCWYGVALLYLPFYEPLRQQIRDHGWKYLYSNGTGFLDLPPLKTLMWQFCRGRIMSSDLIKLVFPLLGMVGVLQTVFLGYHVMYACSAYTTLEYKILLEMQYRELLNGNTHWGKPPNPYCLGSQWKNLQQTLGPWYLIWLPVSIEPRVQPVEEYCDPVLKGKSKTG